MKKIYLQPGTNIEHAYRVLKDCKEPCCADFNGVVLLSTDTLDEMYIKVTKLTKNEMDDLNKKARDEIKNCYESDISRHNNSMGYRQWLYCHTGYEIDGTVFHKGDMHRNCSILPVMNTDKWRAASKEEIKTYYENVYKIKL